MDLAIRVLAVVAIVGGLLSIYALVEVYDRRVRNWRLTYRIDRAPDQRCKRDYAS